MGGFAWVTLATNDSYSLGALVLAHSLKQNGTKHQLAVLITPGVTNAMRSQLSSVFNVVQEVNILDSKDEANLRLLKRPELGITFTKLHCWRLTQYDKCVFLDADTLVLQNCDELFDREELSAAPDVGWPDCFNSGVFVYRPSNETYEKLIQFALDKGSFDGGDQGLLNLFFSDWAHKDISKHLPFIYNMVSTASYSYLPAFKQFGADAKIVHFIGPAKPWLQYFDTETKTVHPSGDLQHLSNVLQRWWNVFCGMIHPSLSPAMARSASDVTHTNNSRHVPQIHIPISQFQDPRESISTNKSDKYPQLWDPWEEYEKKQTLAAQNPPVPTLHQHHHHHTREPSETKPFESHNTNARSDSDAQNRPKSTDPHDSLHQNYRLNPGCEIAHPLHNQSSQEPTHHIVPEDHSIHSRHSTPPSSPAEYQHHSTPPYHANLSSHSNYSNSALHRSIPPRYSTSIMPAAISKSNSTHPPVVVEYSPKPTEPAFPVLPSECQATKATALHTTSPTEDQTDAGLAGAFAQLTLGVPRTSEQSALDDHLRRQGWEVGNIDYLGKDSFDNIWSKICETLAAPPASAPAPIAAAEEAAAPTATPPAPVQRKETTPPSTEAQGQVASEAASQIVPAEGGKPGPEPEPEPVPQTPAVPSTASPQVPLGQCPLPKKPDAPAPAEQAPAAPESQCALPQAPQPEDAPPPPAECPTCPISPKVPVPEAPVCTLPAKPVEPCPKPEVLPPAEASKPETSAPTEAPKPEALLPAEAPKPEAPTPAEAPKPEAPTPAEAPKPEAPLPAEAPKPEAPTPAEAPKPEAPAPAEAPKPEAPVPAETPTPAEAPKPETPTTAEAAKSGEAAKTDASKEATQTPKQTEGSKSTEEPKSTETPKPVEAPKPAESPKPTEAAKAAEAIKPPEVPKPVKAPKPAEVPTPAKAPEPAETPKPTEVPTTAETPKLAETPKPAEVPKASKSVEPSKSAEASKSPGAPKQEEAFKPEAPKPDDAAKPAEPAKSAETSKKQESTKQTAAESSTPTPTPPPRKGSGGTKKSSKPKK